LPWSASTLYGPGAWWQRWSSHHVLAPALHLFPPHSLEGCELPNCGLVAVPNLLEPEECEFPAAVPWDSLVPQRGFDGHFRESGPPSPMLAFLVEQSCTFEQPILFYECNMHGGDIDHEVCWSVQGAKISRHQDWVRGMELIGATIPETGWFPPHTSSFDWRLFHKPGQIGPPLSLYQAAFRQDWTRVEQLIRAGHSPLHYRRKSPLTLAVSAGNVEIARLLLSHGARARSTELAQARTLPLVELLLQAGAIPDQMSVRSVLSKGNEAGFLRLNPLVQLELEEVFISACRGGVISVLDSCYRQRPTIVSHREFGRSAISYAAEGGHQLAVDWLFSRGAVWDGASLHHLAAKGHHQLLRRALESGLAPHEPHYGRLALAGAAAGNQVQSMSILLEFGAEVNQADEFGDTALHSAARSQSLAAIDWLLERGAQLEQRDQSGYTALWVAVGTGDQALVDHLLQAGANPKTMNNYQTPLSVLAEQRDIILPGI
jgi:ankyrin repeat protein